MNAFVRRHLTVLKLSTAALSIAAAVSAVPAVAQETTSSIRGLIMATEGNPADVEVKITHVPSGTVSTATVNEEGRFGATGLRVGGPYTIQLTGPGFKPFKVEEVYVQLGQPYFLGVPMEMAGGDVQEVVITGTRLAELAAGIGTQFSEEDIRNAPSISRDLRDVIRNDPKVSLDPTNVNAISIAGTNNRFNSLTVDGVRQSDDFGLNNNGYPTQRSPISIDAVEQVSVLTAPYDVEYSNFQGGTINIVTKSGTNEFHGSVFGYYNDDSIAGDKSRERDLTFSFEEKTYGGTLGGPILQDKLFFFGSYENFKRKAPVETGPAGSGLPVEVPQVTQADYNAVINAARSVYNFDPLELSDELKEKDEKILGKIDWNITEAHRATFTYQRTEGNEVVQNNSSLSLRRVASPSNWYNRAITMNAYSGQLFSDWTDNFSTELKFGIKEVEVLQNPLAGNEFAEMQVTTPGGGTVYIGPDESRHANYLTNDLQTFKAKAQYLWGDHTFTGGYEREDLDIFNLFVQRAQGQFIFASINDFIARRATTLNYQNAFTNDANDAAADFSYAVDSFYLQDEFIATDALTVQFGVRYDRWSSDDTPPENANYIARNGFSNTETLDGRDLWQPRLGITYQATDTTTIRGGAGKFGGGSPNVWISNSFSNDGTTVVSQTINRTSPLASALDNVNGFDLPQNVLNNHTTLRGNGPVNAIDPKFKIPSSWRYSFAVDQVFDMGALGDEWQLTAEVLYTETEDAPIWRDLVLTRTGTAPDGRPIYGRRTGVPGSVGNDLLLTNTGEGHGLVLSFDLSKQWATDFGDFDGRVGYAYQDIKDVNPGTSSTALSNWDNLATSDINDPDLATSNYEIKHRFTYGGSWAKAFFGDYETGFSFFGESRIGRPYSYTFAGNSPVFGDPRQGSRQRQLFYVPRDQNDVILGAGLTWAQLDKFITDEGLDNYRGQIAPRNGFNSPWVHQIDIRFSQEIPGIFEGHKGIFTFDILNFGNLVNSDWGRLEQVSFPGVSPVVQAALDPATGKYVYTLPSGSTTLQGARNTLSAQNSVWRMQVGVRYEF